MTDYLGWIATAVFVSSYFFKRPAWLRAAQMGVAGDPPSLPEGFEGFGISKLWQEAA